MKRNITIILFSISALIAGGLGCNRERKSDSSARRTPETPPAQVIDTAGGKRASTTPPAFPKVIVPVEQKTVGSTADETMPSLPSLSKEEYWPNGGLKLQSRYIGDSTERHIKVTLWYENGQKQREEEYLRMRKEGPFITWYQSGGVEYQGLYRKDRLEDTCWLYWENGKPKQMLVYESGVKSGPFELYFDTGRIEKRGNNLNDKWDGPYTTYFRSGIAEFKGQYKDGLMDGVWEKYYETGTLKARSEYKAGKRNGRYQQWDENGIPVFDDTYVDGKLIPSDSGK